jgi:hypothetical protein
MATLAFADNFAATLHTLCTADWTDYLVFLQFLVRLGLVLCSLHYLPVALMRLSFVASVLMTMFTVIPGFRSTAVAFMPFTLISVN